MNCVSIVTSLSTLTTNFSGFPTDDESGNIKSSKSKSKMRDDELQVRLGLFLENNNSQGQMKHKQLLSSFGSNNTSPLSTLTNSSEADMSRGSTNDKCQASNRGFESVGSLLSVSISENSNASSNSLGRRFSTIGEFFILTCYSFFKIFYFRQSKST